jgi:glycyl-tRNA synthetase beta chain
MSVPFLLEIGTEEIPDWMIEPALASLSSLFGGLLADERLQAGAIRTDATPRRLVLRATELAERQADREELVSGPPVSAAFKDGQPTGAALGFARKMGVDVAALERHETPRGEYLAYRKKTAGRASRDILAEALPELILKIQWPKTMYWGAKGGPRFIRPIRWLVALAGQEVVPFEIAGVRSGAVSSGHRQLGAAEVPVTIEDFDKQLYENGVIVSGAVRRIKIGAQIDALLMGKGLRIKEDPALLETLAYITERPSPVLGTFDKEYLNLPAEVLVTVMRHHQKYFSVEDEEGRLAPHFVAVMNTSSDPEGLVRQGNERVTRARFNDARFFWSVDLKKTLADRVADLAHVTFQTKLGSYLAKTKRVQRLARKLARQAKVDPAPVERAALLAKCDLTTDMVKELTELQGVMGGLYAREQGEPEEVWRAIYEHYKPESMEDAIPATPVGRLLSLADKLDTLQGCFKIGLVPTGSKDPLALRRAAQGVVKILVDGKLSLSLSKLAAGDQALLEFLLDRVRYYFKDIRGFRYDEVNAVLAAGHDNLPDVESRLAAIQAVRPTENFEPLAASFKRIKNILRQADFTPVTAPNRDRQGADVPQAEPPVPTAPNRDRQGAGAPPAEPPLPPGEPPLPTGEPPVTVPSRDRQGADAPPSEPPAPPAAVQAARLEPGPEAELFQAFEKLRKRVKRSRSKKQYQAALEAIASIRPQVDLFFDKVLVNAPDPDVRRNRLTLLHQLLSESSAIADFSEIVATEASASAGADKTEPHP